MDPQPAFGKETMCHGWIQALLLGFGEEDFEVAPLLVTLNYVQG